MSPTLDDWLYPQRRKTTETPRSMTFDEWEKLHRPTEVKATLDRGEPIFICEIAKGAPLAIVNFSDLQMLRRKFSTVKILRTLRR